jgi:hypothetical protein
MLMGTSVSRAIRGHLIVNCVLHILLISNILGLNLLNAGTEDEENNDQIDKVEHKRRQWTHP